MKLCLLLDFLIFFLNSDILKVDEIKENRIFFSFLMKKLLLEIYLLVCRCGLPFLFDFRRFGLSWVFFVLLDQF